MRAKKQNNPVYLNNDVHKGSWCITGTNIPVFVIFDYLGNGYSLEEITERLPTVSLVKIQKTILYVSKNFQQFDMRLGT